MTEDTDTDYIDRIVDSDSLAAYLETHLGPVDTYDIEHHPEGHSNETLFVTWGENELVIRRPPPGETADTAHNVLREYRIIDALQETAVCVPTTVLACDDHSVLGSDFYVMEKQDGDVVRGDEPDRFERTEHRQRIGTELVDRLAEIHKVDYDKAGLGDLGRPSGFTQRQVDRWSDQLDWAFEVTSTEREVPRIHKVTEWLQENVPSEYPHTLVHGDYKLDNVMFGPRTPPEIANIFDWELSTLGDPLTDLGWMLSFWWDKKDPDPPSSVGQLYEPVTMRDGYHTRAELVERYENQTEFTFENEKFYRTLAVYKLAGLGEMFFRRYLEGNSDDPLYPEMREGVPQLADRGIRIIEDEEPI
jgi:aminoglycoside phosphotransferase (APT) family kinase protein